MPQTFLIFDFGSNEDAAQQARHRLDGLRQGFRLGNKVQFKFERQNPDSSEKEETPGKGKKKEEKAESNPSVRLLVRLDFSNHEKHLFQEWLRRIPADEAFKSAKSEVIHHGQPAFDPTTELFDNLS